MKHVLILDANQRSALAVTRSLGMKGIKLVTADDTTSSLAGSSKYSTVYIQHPPAHTDPEAFIDQVADICREYGIEMVIPMTELTAALLLKHRAILPELTLPLAETKSIDLLSDKCRLVELAKSLQIPVPSSVQQRAGEDVDLERQLYPMVLKPAKSWLQIDQHWLHTTVRFANSHEQARDILTNDIAFNSEKYMLQQHVPGHGEGVFAVYNDGKALAFFAHKRLREKPPRGGVSVLSESVEVSPQLECYAKKLLDHVRWHGVAMVEFRVDDEGNAWLMEVNTRFWGSLQLAVDAGVDFPWLLYRISCGDKVERVNNYKTGRRLRWLLGDLDSLYITLKDKEFSVAVKALSILKFMTPAPFKTRHEVNRLYDLKPFWWELKKYISDLSK
jgi:predicted ATP-grasp superfamily ATP-dependent carboligase